MGGQVVVPVTKFQDAHNRCAEKAIFHTVRNVFPKWSRRGSFRQKRSLDHQAIRRAYPDVTVIQDSKGAFKADGTEVTLVQSAIDAARVELDNEATASAYQRSRTGEEGEVDTIYLPISEQLDMQYWDSVNGTTTWKDHIAAVKAKYPKPS